MATTKLELSAEPREVFGKRVRRLRRQGLVPANIYGHGDARAIQTPSRALDVLLAHGGRTGLVSISIPGSPSETALVKDIQRDPRSGHIVHVEFQAVSMNESVTSTVPIRFVGESPAVTKLDGVMSHPRTEVRVTARAADLPDAIEVDVSTITELHGSILVGDLPESPRYKVIDAPEDVLAMVAAPKVAEEDEETTAEPGAAEPGTETAATGTSEDAGEAS